MGAMSRPHLCHGVVCDEVNSKIYAVGGIRSGQSRVVECYDAMKNEWLELPSTLYQHTWFPDVQLKDGFILQVTGNHYNWNTSDESDWGHSEYFGSERIKKTMANI